MRKKFKKSYIISIIFAFAYVNKLKANLNNNLTQILTEISRSGSYNINTKINSGLKILETIATFVGRHSNLVDGTVMDSLRDELRTNANFTPICKPAMDSGAVRIRMCWKHGLKDN